MRRCNEVVMQRNLNSERSFRLCQLQQIHTTDLQLLVLDRPQNTSFAAICPMRASLAELTEPNGNCGFPFGYVVFRLVHWV